MTKQYDIDSLLEEVVTLPSLPHTLARVTVMVDDPNCSIADVGKVIATDPALAMKALRLINSAHYGLPERVTSIEHACAMLGQKVVKNLVLTATVFNTFKGNVDSLMRHSVATGIAMQAIVAVQGLTAVIPPEDAFVYGLLHDVGKILMEEFLSEDYARVLAIAKENRLPQHVVETKLLGVDHAAVGARLAMNWKLPKDLVLAIAGHHRLEHCTAPESQRHAAELAVADYIANAAGIQAHEGVVYDIAEAYWEHSQITSTKAPQVLDKFFADLPVVDEMLLSAVA